MSFSNCLGRINALRRPFYCHLLISYYITFITIYCKWSLYLIYFYLLRYYLNILLRIKTGDAKINIGKILRSRVRCARGTFKCKYFNYNIIYGHLINLYDVPGLLILMELFVPFLILYWLRLAWCGYLRLPGITMFRNKYLCGRVPNMVGH